MPLLIVDRDGVINHDSEDYIKSPAEWMPIAGSLEALARASQAGYRIVVVSNQAGLAYGLFNVDTLNEIHAKMIRELKRFGGEIEAIFFCPHAPEAGCECRKPRPGMLKEIGARLRMSLEDVPFIGDKLSDVQAARAVQARPLLVLTGYGQETIDREDVFGIEIYPDLAAAIADLVEEAEAA
jgi:D-glycero-D-manno-heptose 1,7-bisphosphate phosphatase